MTRARFLALNALSMLLANILSKAVLFVGYVFLLQYLDASLESTYYLITAFAMVICTNFQDGMVFVTIRRIATDLPNGPRHLGNLYLASFFLAVVLGLLAIPAAFLYARTQLEGSGLQGEFILSVCALTAAYLVGYGYACAGAGFKAYERLYLEAILLFIQSVLNAGILVYGSINRWPLSSLFFGLLAAAAFHALLSNIVLVAFVVRPRIRWAVGEAWALFRRSLALGYATLMRTLQDRIHPFFIDRLAGHSLITQFSSPNNLLIQLKFIPMSVRPALFPTLARKADEKTDAFQVYSLALMKFLYLIALPLLILLSIVRHELLPLITSMDPTFKRTYALALQVYPIIAWAVALSFPSQVLRSLFVAVKRPQHEFHTVLAGVVVLVALDIILIPQIGVLGCACAAVACELTILFFGLWLLSRVGRGINVMSLFFLPTLCGIIVHLVAEYLYGTHWTLGILCVLLAFPLLVLVLRVISPTEWRILREIVQPNWLASR